MNLDSIMRDKGISNAQIATRFNTTPSTVSRWRNNINSPDNSILPELCDFLGCSLDELLRAVNPTPPLPNREQGEETTA
ncbi:helix-turn-helix domain-containing protein [Cloacibacillus evryensis]|uniref:helix-turn-helix domain-containing protein n=1 Tax=Cloacibacillus evryensis TaxID=508460 RepID=UPI003C6C6C1E